jgi:xanthine dehydrogenase accessory factor
MADIFREVVNLHNEGDEGAWVVVTATKGHTPQVVGAKMLVRADGSTVGTVGGGRIEHEVLALARETIRTGEAIKRTFRLKAELAMCCGGEMEVFIEKVQGAQRLILFGAGHVAQPTAQIASLCGFQVWVVDEREDWNSMDRFSVAAHRLQQPYEDVLAKFEFRDSDVVVIATHNHDHDREILSRSLHLHSGYVGMIGSCRKVEKTLKELRLAGVSEELLKRAHAPIGLDILAETPEEIAVAIVGELVRFRHMKSSKKETRGATVALLSEGSGN